MISGLALFATALGLITAIPLAFAHVLLKAWVSKYEVRMKSAAQKLLILMQTITPAVKGPAATVSSTNATAKPASAVRWQRSRGRSRRHDCR